MPAQQYSRIKSIRHKVLVTIAPRNELIILREIFYDGRVEAVRTCFIMVQRRIAVDVFCDAVAVGKKGNFQGMFFHMDTISIEGKNPSRKHHDGFFITSFLLHPRAASAEWPLPFSFVFSQMV